MKNEYEKGLREGLRILEDMLDRLEMDRNFSLENARENLRDRKNILDCINKSLEVIN